jgi:AraC-like DNA-binding protein
MKQTQVQPATGGPPPEFFSPQVLEAQRFYLDLNPPGDSQLAVVCGGVEWTTPDYAIHRLTFPFHCIEYVALGRGVVKLGSQNHALQPGRLFSYGPGIRQDITSDPASPLVKYFVNFAGTRARELLRSCGLGPGRIAGSFPPNEVQAVFDELIHCGVRHSSRTTELCVRLLECLALKIADSRAPLGSSEALAFSTYQHCHQHIRQHFRRLRSLQQISAECRVNHAYLCRLFRRFDHQSPYQYLLRLKMNLAAGLLQQPGVLVKQVAERAGFGDPFHFSRAFKAVFGMSPDAFRKWR